jgi:hypothetical protein
MTDNGNNVSITQMPIPNIDIIAYGIPNVTITQTPIDTTITKPDALNVTIRQSTQSTVSSVEYRTGRRTNLVLNPSFEVNTTGWSPNSTTQTRITTDSYFGNASDRLVATTTFTNGGMVLTRNATYAIPITPGTTYTVSAYIKRTVGSRAINFRAITKATAASGTAIETFNSPTTSSTSWTRIVLTFTPTNVTGLFMEIFIRNSTAGAVGDTFLVDGVFAVVGSDPSYYWDGSYTDIPIDNDPVIAWTGTANNSTSIMTQNQAGTLTISETNLTV